MSKIYELLASWLFVTRFVLLTQESKEFNENVGEKHWGITTGELILMYSGL